MKHAVYLWGALILSMILILALFWRVLRLDSQVQSLNRPNTGGLVALQDSLKPTQADLASIKELAPGLGEYMTQYNYMRVSSGSPPRLSIGSWRNMSLMN